MAGQFVRNYGQVISGLIIGACSLGGTLGAGLFIGSEVEEGLKSTPANIQVSAQGFGSKGGNRLLIAHNYGEEAGTLLPEITIAVMDAGNNSLGHITEMLNEGTAGYGADNPFTLPGNGGRRFYLNTVSLPSDAASCVLEFRVMQSDRDPRRAETPPFDCVKRNS